MPYLTQNYILYHSNKQKPGSNAYCSARFDRDDPQPHSSIKRGSSVKTQHYHTAHTHLMPLNRLSSDEINTLSRWMPTKS
jgi:hypothetical protein